METENGIKKKIFINKKGKAKTVKKYVKMQKTQTEIQKIHPYVSISTLCLFLLFEHEEGGIV